MPARPTNIPEEHQALRLIRVLLTLSLTLSALLYFLWSWRWPLVGDASLMHYIVFLIERHWAPYRDLGDMNMPGSYLIELAAMHLFGAGALAWRLFDFTLLALATAAFFAITRRPQNRVPHVREATVGITPVSTRSSSLLSAIFAGSLFILVHGRDGLAQGGQRDLTMAICLLAATAFLLHAIRKNTALAAAAFGLLSGIAVTIKPTTVLLTLAQLALALYAISRNSRLKLLAATVLAYLIAPTTVLLFLFREHALAAFLAGLHTVVPYYASLGHRPLSYVLLHSISPLLPLVILWLAVLALDRPMLFRPALDIDRALLAAGVLFGLVNCILQARALPYYRYPLLAFLLPLMALDFTAPLANKPGAPSKLRLGGPAATDPGAPSKLSLGGRAATDPGAPSKLRLGGRGATNPGAPHPGVPGELARGGEHLASEMWVGSRTVTRLLAYSALIVGAFFLAPQSAILIHRYRWAQTDFITSLEQNLATLGGAQLSGHIQCIDTNSGCGNVLYLMRLEPATGVLSDFFLFGDSNAPAVRQTRDQFSAAILAHPAQVIVVTSRLYLADPGDYDNYAKLDRWPAFQSFLANRYTLQTQWTPTRTERWWSREEYPAAYRIYVLRP